MALLHAHALFFIFTVFIIITSFSSETSCFRLHDSRAYTTSRIVSIPSTSTSTSTSPPNPELLNVDAFGAKGDGGDDTQAFKKAWREACSSKDSVLVVPQNRSYHLKPITFKGPCNSNFTFKVYGTIKASPHKSDYQKHKRQWLVFQNIQNFTVEGGGTGTINGNGKRWWNNSCKINKTLPCTHAPTAVTFLNCNNLTVDNFRIKNAPQMHLTFQRCSNVKASRLVVTAPEHSPNTDGIHVTETKNIHIQNCIIGTGDDCISIVSGSENVEATDITCGPGHGISIGSLGAGGSSDYVSNVLVDRAILSGTTNGLRIKTWQDGSRYAKNITFQNVEMHSVQNPIIINQYYCDKKKPSCSEEASAVKVSNIVYKNITGVSASEEAINFKCSKSFLCREIWLEDLNLARQEDESIKASCESVKYLTNQGTVSPLC